MSKPTSYKLLTLSKSRKKNIEQTVHRDGQTEGETGKRTVRQKNRKTERQKGRTDKKK
jgi:hypothetical protein